MKKFALLPILAILSLSATADAGSLKDADAILVPGGFGSRGTKGKILAVQYARENNVPYLGICLGMQIAVIEFARHIAGLTDPIPVSLTKPASIRSLILCPVNITRLIRAAPSDSALIPAIFKRARRWNAFTVP